MSFPSEEAVITRVLGENRVVKLNVGGSLFTTSLTTLQRFPNTKLGAMFSNIDALVLDGDGYHFIDRDGTHFRYILNFLRAPKRFEVGLTPLELRELKCECDYYGLLSLMFPYCPLSFPQLKNVDHKLVDVVQSMDGVFYMNNGSVQLCRECGAANHKMVNAQGQITGTSYVANFRAVVEEKGGDIRPAQPKLIGPCGACKRVFSEYE